MEFNLSDVWDTVSGVGTTAAKIGDQFSGVGNLALGAWGLYQGQQAADTASSFYDAAGKTAQQRWDWWMDTVAPVEQARMEQEMINAGFVKGTDATGNATWTMSPETAAMFAQQDAIRQGNLDMAELSQGISHDFLTGNRDNILSLQNQNLANAQTATALQGNVLTQKQKDLELYDTNRGLEQLFFDKATAGLDPNEYANRYAGDVALQFDESVDRTNRTIGRMGSKAGSVRSVTANRNLDANRALGVAGARQQGRDYADNVSLDRLMAAVNVRKNLSPAGLQMPGGTAVNLPNIAVDMGTTATGGMSMPDLSGTYANLGGVAANAAAANNTQGMYNLNRLFNPAP